ncbi:MAG: hypothetical protein C0404_02140 [Verrucomicrobia bacterium]|nr:hypothetical protein [Verrucomicrobiota bacterium]
MQTDAIIALAKKKGVVRSADLDSAIGASRTLLPYLAQRGVLRRIARGAYVLAGFIPEQEGFLKAAVAVPHGVFCLLSALQYHEITTQVPNEVWVAIERGTHVPALGKIGLRIVKLTGPLFSSGMEEHESDGVTFRVYSPAKTVVDCFRFRNRVGLDVAREALTDSLAQRKATRDEIWRYAKICRMAKIMRPYLEMAG